MQTFLDMLPLLNLSSGSFSQALLRYADSTLELHTGIKKRYIQSYVLSETLTQINYIRPCPDYPDGRNSIPNRRSR